MRRVFSCSQSRTANSLTAEVINDKARTQQQLLINIDNGEIHMIEVSFKNKFLVFIDWWEWSTVQLVGIELLDRYAH